MLASRSRPETVWLAILTLELLIPESAGPAAPNTRWVQSGSLMLSTVPGNRTLAVRRSQLAGQRGANVGKHSRPVAIRLLPEQPHGRVPGAAGRVQEPAPVGG